LDVVPVAKAAGAVVGCCECQLRRCVRFVISVRPMAAGESVLGGTAEYGGAI
jgi:hypothetical protein